MDKGFPATPDDPIEGVQPWEYIGNRVHPTEKAVSILVPLIESFSRGPKRSCSTRLRAAVLRL